MRHVLRKAALLGAASFSAFAGAQAMAQDAGDSDIIIVGRRLSQADEAIGLNETANTVAVTREALLSAPAGISGLKMLEQLPGFNVQTDGALGLYEFGNSVTVRAFNLQQIGFVLDGIPMGRSDAFGGSPIFRYVDNENLGAVVASPGAGDVSQPSYASLGPIVEYRSVEPSDEFGGMISQAWGDFGLNRSFVKIETGNIAGFSAYVSRSKTDSDLWRGAGFIDREHWEAKARYEWDDDTYLSVQYVSNDFFDYDSPSVSLAQYNSGAPCANGQGGRYCGYSATLPPGTLGTVLVYNVPGYTYDTTGWYLDRVNIRTDSLFGANFETDIGDALSVAVTAYYEDKDGYGVSPETYGSTTSATSLYGRYLRQSQAGLPVTAPRGTAFGLSGVGGVRKGVVVSGALDLGGHVLEAGAWFENDDYTRTQLRINHAGGIQSGAVLYSEVNYFRRNYNSVRETTQLFLKDTISLLDDQLTVEVGVKALSIDYSLDGYRDFNDYYLVVGGVGTPGYGPQSISANYEDMFLPMIGAVYDLTSSTQVFASYAQNFALPRGADDIFSLATNPAFNVPAPEGEEAENFELGVRTLTGEFDAAFAVFYTSFENRLESFSSPVPGQTGALETFSQNVGAVTSYGAEFTGAWKPSFFHDYAYFNGNVTYNQTEFEDNTGATTIPIAGNTLPDSPEWVVTAGFTVEPTPWIVGNISARYVSERYSNFVNTEKIDGFTVVSAYLDFGDGTGDGPLGHFKARVNVDNLFDEDSLAFISSSIAGNASFRPQSPRTFSFSISAEF
ncbi:MAG: TonB-dependent receptor [Alphaproteobacteria bacterium]|nr:TonB-dependent receptor [Alphaproteobacteria bacterium]